MIFFISCDKDEDSENILIKNAIIYIDETELDNCRYSVKTVDNEFFSTQRLPEKVNSSKVEAQITYTITEHTINCGFGGYLREIKIISMLITK